MSGLSRKAAVALLPLLLAAGCATEGQQDVSRADIDALTTRVDTAQSSAEQSAQRAAQAAEEAAAAAKRAEEAAERAAAASTRTETTFRQGLRK